MSKNAIHSDGAPAAIGTYSQAIEVGGLVFLSGQIPLDPATMEVVDGNFDARARRVFDNLAEVAAAAGGSVDDVVKLTVSTVSWKTTSVSRTRHGPQSVSRHCRRASMSRLTRYWRSGTRCVERPPCWSPPQRAIDI